MLASEAAPFAKVGGLGDFSAALTRYLGMDGHEVRLFMPAYSAIDWAGHEVGPVEFLRDVPLEMGGRSLQFTGLYSNLPGTSVQVYFIDCPDLYDRPTVYSSGIDEAVRFAFFTQATLECCQRMGWSPQVFHCNDWHASLLPIYLRSTYGWDELFAHSRSLLTIHNIGYQGVFSADTLDAIGLRAARAMFGPRSLAAGEINMLEAGILHADVVTTVSPTHAKEIQTPVYGMGLDSLLRRRADRLVGILNGVDYEEWDPSHDQLLPYTYTRDDLRGKAHNKRALLKDASLPYASRTPLIGMVTRLVEQKGIDLLPEVLPEVLSRHDCRLIVLGSGEERYEEFFWDLQEQFPAKVFFYRGYSNELAHRIEAAGDIFLMPSMYEPCGLNQMYSLRYGTVPVVRRTGGLADAVEPFDPASRQGTGFLFGPFTSTDLRVALEEALHVYAKPRLWRRLVRNGMSRDFSWRNQVGRYVDLYRELVRLA